MNLIELENKTREELEVIARERGIAGYSALKKADLAREVLRCQAEQGGNLLVTGVLDIMDEGYGFLRQDTFMRGINDVYVSNSQVRRFNLKSGDSVYGQARPPKETERYYSLLRVERINDLDPESARGRQSFGALVPVFPDELINLETTSDELATQLVNLVSPIGRGQRGLIVSPPKAGKTLLLKRIANAIAVNCPDIRPLVQ